MSDKAKEALALSGIDPECQRAIISRSARGDSHMKALLDAFVEAKFPTCLCVGGIWNHTCPVHALERELRGGTK